MALFLKRFMGHVQKLVELIVKFSSDLFVTVGFVYS